MSNLALPSNMPVGFRFHPTDEELVTHYLKHKIMGKDSLVDHIISEVDFCRWEPWELPSKSRVQSGDKVWWFFCRRDYRYPSSTRSKRTTGTGYWKITGKERKIKGKKDTNRASSSSSSCIVGKKKTLVFYKGPTPGKRTNWVMQELEFEPDNALPNQRPYVICRLKKKSDEKVESPNGDEGEPSGEFASDFENQQAPLGILGVPGFQDVNLEPISQTLLNGFSSDYDWTQALVSADESEECPEEFVNSLIVEPDDDFHVDMAHKINNIPTLTSLKRQIFFGGPVSSDTDNEGVNYIQNQETSSMFDSPGGSKKVRHLKMMKTPGETLRTSTGEPYRVETVDPGRIQFAEEDDSSGDSNQSVAGSIFYISSVKEERPRSIAVSRGGHQRRIRLQENVSLSPRAVLGDKGKEAAKHDSTAVDMPRKEKSSKDQSQTGRKMVQSSSVAEKHLQSASWESSESKWKSFITFTETSSLSSSTPRPPSEYFFNAVVGVILFLIFVRELVVFGSWC